MIRRGWDALYQKRAQVDARRSGLGCLLASVGLIVVCALLSLLAGRPWVLGRSGEAQRQMAQNALDEIEEALVRLLHDANVDTPADLFEPGVLQTMDAPQATAAAHGQVLRQLLREGKETGLALRPEVRARLAPTYLHVRQDSWGNPYLAHLLPQTGSPSTTWTLFATGPNGTLDFPEPGDDLLRVHP